MESAIGAEPLSKGLSTAFVRVSAQEFQGRVAAGTGRRGGWRKTRLAAGDRRGDFLPPEETKAFRPRHTPIVAKLKGIAEDRVGRVRTVLGVETQAETPCAGDSHGTNFPTPFLRRGATDVCPGFAAKGLWNRVFLPVFELPDEGYQGYLRGRIANVPPGASDWRNMLMVLILNHDFPKKIKPSCVLNQRPQRVSAYA